MTKILIVVSFLFLSSVQALALELICEGWHQNPADQLERVVMTKGEQTNLNWKQSTEVAGFRYAVDWDVNLDTIYVTIGQGEKRLLFATARVPTFPHNDSFTDLNLPGGPRLAVSCSFK